MSKPIQFADAHNDLLQRALAGDSIEKRLPDGHSDFVRIREAGVILQLLSVWVPVRYETQGQSFHHANRLIDAFESAVERDRKITGSDSSTRFLLGMEGAHPLENSMENVRWFANRKIRYMSPTWNNSTRWASSARDEHSGQFTGHKGLTEEGRDFVREMERFSIIPDVSHVGEETFRDMARVCEGPIMASHSSCYELCSHPRNLKDWQMEAIAKSGGVVCINFFSGFLDPGYFPRRNARLTEIKSRTTGPRESDFPNYEAYFTAEDRWVGEQVADLRPDMDILADHIIHAVKIAGDDHVGIGTDFDGIESAPTGLDSVSDLQKIPELLRSRGMTDSSIRKICSDNLLRLFP